jgi:signal transduction histidine kinase
MKLLKLDKIKDEFLANTSHELRTPLNGILGITEAMLKGSAGSMSESQKQNLSIIAGSSRRLANLINDILDYSKMKYGDIKLDIRPIHIESLIYNVVSVFRQLNNTKNYEIFYELPDKLPAVMADENRVLQILYNLVGNAAKYTVSGYIKISAKISEDMLEICVRDTGEGIPDDKLEDIFLSFEQVDNSITRRHGGTGLGLPITKHLVELQGGSIWVKSRQGEGTEFYLTLPMANTQQEKAVLKEGMPEEYSLKGDIRKGDILKENVLKRDVLKRDVLKGNMLKEDSMKGDILKEDILKRDSLKEDILKYNALIENERNTLLSEMAVSDITVSECGRTLNSMDINEGAVRVLLVDDDSVNLQAASAILKLGGYKVTMAGSGRVALKELEKQTDYSLVILDVMMPEMSGFEVCKKLRERKSAFELPVLMLTAKTSTEDIVMGFESGANDYLPKPFEPEELLARVKTLTNLKRSVEKAKAAEIAFMQAQIKPHFLYNTLNAISSFCDTDPGHAQKLIDNFSNYLRQSFDFKSPEMYVPLEKELSLSSSYAEIEKARFGNKLKVEFDIDSSIKIRVPLLSIQPLIENAITHGIRKKGGGGTVKISVNRIPEGVLVTVEDNGQGMSQEILQTLFMPEAGHGIGLWNINRRLKKLYGKGLSIESEPGKGTRIAFIIPGEAS